MTACCECVLVCGLTMKETFSPLYDWDSHGSSVSLTKFGTNSVSQHILLNNVFILVRISK